MKIRKSISAQASDLLTCCLNRNPAERLTSSELLEHPAFKNFQEIPAEDHSQDSRGKQFESMHRIFQVVTSSKVNQKILVDDDNDFSDMVIYQSNTKPNISPSFMNSKHFLIQKVAKVEERAGFEQKVDKKARNNFGLNLESQTLEEIELKGTPRMTQNFNLIAKIGILASHRRKLIQHPDTCEFEIKKSNRRKEKYCSKQHPKFFIFQTTRHRRFLKLGQL